jgi:hypothetical protein
MKLVLPFTKESSSGFLLFLGAFKKTKGTDIHQIIKTTQHFPHRPKIFT